jgi:hypothetical protein
MTVTQVLFDGQTDGATATSALLTGNAGTSVAGTSFLQFSTSDGMRSTTGLHVSVNSSGACYVRYNMNADNDKAAFSFVFRTPATNPSANAPMFNVRTGTGRAATVGISPNGRLYVADGAAAGGTVTYITPTVGTLTASTKYRCELRLQGNTTTAGHIDAAVYNPTDTSGPISSITPITNANLTAATLHQIEIGNNASGQANFDFGIDDVQMDDGRLTEIGPILVALTTPTVTLGTTTNPSTTGGTDGSQVVTWGAITNANSYDAYKATKASPAQSDFTLVASSVTSPYTFTGLAAGTYSFGILANP